MKAKDAIKEIKDIGNEISTRPKAMWDFNMLVHELQRILEVAFSVKEVNNG